MFTDKQIEAAAAASHEVNRIYCKTLGDDSQPHYEDAPGWQQSSAVNGVKGVIAGNTPEQSHESWLAEKEATGWKYGPVKDPEKKEHPCFVPYAELPPEQKAKDAIYVGTVRAMLAGFAE
jgi:RyR domain-containing protein